MMHLKPCLEANLWKALAEAANTPEKVDLSSLWEQVEAAIAQAPESLRLQVAGKAILQLAEVYSARANFLLQEWEMAQQSARPVTEDGLSDLLLRQSMQMDFSDLMEVPVYKYKRADSGEPDRNDDSLALSVEKTVLLEAFNSEIELVEAEAQTTSGVVAVAEAEDVMGWAEAITQWMQQSGNSKTISLVQLQQELGMPMVEVWLGVILSQEQYQLEQREEFYSLHGIWLRQMAK